VSAGECESGSDDWDFSCEAYQPVLNAEGRNVLIGAAAFEGYLTSACLGRLAVCFIICCCCIKVLHA
jgi:hypothetical protein